MRVFSPCAAGFGGAAMAGKDVVLPPLYPSLVALDAEGGEGVD